ncbi:MAG: DHA2 family efflux MFS transporter permease subunit [Pseudomonadota bacterium]|nr:DHA2 family efflux MFS transporter permease subunit [Pseudomonadota bacterium]
MPNNRPLHGTTLALLTLALGLGTFMQVLDTSIANVSIPSIAGDLAVSPDQGTWVITSFAVSNAIALPVTGWAAKRFGEVRLFCLSTLLFTLFSWLCGLAPNLPMLVLSRVLQGAVAGPMIPLSQSLLLANYPDEKKGLALALWSMTVILAPIFGPILGGYITDNYNWPWIFYINIPVGIASAFLVWSILRHRETLITRLPIDTVGLILLTIGVGSLQVLLDKGHDLDWFNSPLIITLAISSFIALSFLIVWEIYDRHPVLNLRLFLGRNFTIGVIATTLGYLAYFVSVVIFPLWLQTNMGYTASWAGLAAAPIGILAVIISPFVGRYLHHFDLRLMVTFAFAVFAGVSFWNATFDSQVDFIHLIIPRIIMGAGMATFFIPLVTITLSGLKPEVIADASGLYNFLRILGGSFGTSISINTWSNRAIVHHSRLAEAVGNNPVTSAALSKLHQVGIHGDAAYVFINQELTNQAVMLATNDIFWISGWLFLLLLGFTWLARPPFTSSGKHIAVE